MPKKNSNNKYLKLQTESEGKFKATKHINFGIAIFVVIFAYLVFVIITFAVKEKVDYTIAEIGELSKSNTYTGLIIRKEEVVVSEDEGYIRYFTAEGSRIRKGNDVSAIVTNTSKLQLLDEKIFETNQALELNNIAYSEDSINYYYLKNRIKNYVINQHNKKFVSTYMTKKQIQNDISDIRNTVIQQQAELGLTASTNALLLEEELSEGLSVYKAPRSGIVSYHIDGLEDIFYDTLQIADLAREPKVQKINTESSVANEQPIFKIVDNYLWYIAAEIDNECKMQIEDKNYIGIEFPEKNISIDVKVKDILTEGKKVYLILEVDRMMTEFLTDRFLQFEIIYEDYKGIKIPETAVTTKLFAKIPLNYYGYINNQYGIKYKVDLIDVPGQSTIDVVPVKILKRDDSYIYVPINKNIKIGDVLSDTDADTLQTTEFTIEETVEIEGVYVVNKGFAVFKFIDTAYQEQDYRIIEPYISYGVRIYDRIATEGNLIEEYQVVN